MGTAIKDLARRGSPACRVCCSFTIAALKLLRRYGLPGVWLLSLSACSTLNSTPAVVVEKDSPIAILPFENLSSTPQADTRLRRLVETQLRREGVQRVYVYESATQMTLRTLLNSQAQVDEAKQWARAQGALYGFMGSVHEWQYKSGADREPVVGMTLSLIDLASGDVVWQGNSARTGWGYANLSAVADKAVAGLMRQVTFSMPGTPPSLSLGNQ